MNRILHDFFQKHREWIAYIFFGAFTTAVNFAVYYPIYNFVHLSASASNFIAWLAAVVFAFIVNKGFVFRSKDWSPKTIASEGLKFTACRVFSGMAETGLLFLLVDYLCLNGNIWKLLISIIVIILNYLGSKIFVFSKLTKQAP